MAKRKTQETEAPAEEISLLRLEERVRMVELTAEEKCERLEIANNLLLEKAALETEVADLKERIKEKSNLAEAKQSESNQTVTEAHNGKKGEAYPVIIARNEERLEMRVWAVPLGVEAQALLDEQAAEGETEQALRERQGCTLVDTRAMSPEELDVAKAEDHRRKHPELPFPEAPVGAPTGEQPAEGERAAEGEGAKVLPFEAPTAEGEQGAGGEASGEAAPVDGEKKGIAPCLCPAILQFGTLITDDVLCGQPGSRRKRGLCDEHQRADSGVINDWIARRDTRRKEQARLDRLAPTQASDAEFEPEDVEPESPGGDEQDGAEAEEA
jgi:hypothetical protein